MLKILILGLSLSINVIKLDQLAMQRGKDLVQVSLVIRGNKKRLKKFQYLIIWCVCSMPQLVQTIFLIWSPWQISAGGPKS